MLPNLKSRSEISFWFILLTFLPTLLLGQATNDSKIPGKLLLKSGFEAGTYISDDMTRILGSDVPESSWTATPSWIKSSRFVYIVGKDVVLSDFMESTIETQDGPRGNKTKVLRMVNKADDPDHTSTSRNEFSFFSKEPPDDYQEGYVRYWMKLQDNLKDLVPFDKSSPFYLIMEWKEPGSGNKKTAVECKECCNQTMGGTNNYRININIRKNANSDEFFWTVRGEHPQPCRAEEWRYDADDVKVPMGEWFLVEAYMKKHATEGRVYFAINNQVVLDTNKIRPEGFTGRTQHADNPLPLLFWSPMKNYHSMEWHRLGPVSQWYDDFELWSTFPPGHPAVGD